MKFRAAALVVGAASLLGLIVWMRPPAETPGGPPNATDNTTVLRDERARPTTELATPPLPDSLSGTQEDGALIVGSDGAFIATPDAIDLFDYYLSATGEEPDDQIHARIIGIIAARLEGVAADDARALFENYLRYRERAGELLTGPLVGEDTDRRLQYIRELRREVFGVAVARALFGEEEDRWFVELERRRILNDESLDSIQREERLEALDAEQPPEIVAAHDAARAHRILRDQEEQLRASGAGEQEISLLREEQFGKEASQRLGELDEERARWQRRVDSYRSDRDQRLSEVSREERASVLEQVQLDHFESSELLRVRALDRAEQMRR